MEKCRYYKNEASLTVEAAFVIPIAFYAMYLFLYLFLVIHTEFSVYQSIFSINDTIYKYGTVSAYAEKSTVVTDVIEAAKKSDISDRVEELSQKAFSYILGKSSHIYIGLLLRDYFADSGREAECIRNGVNGIDYSGSIAYGGQNRINLHFEYFIRFPGDYFGLGDRLVVQGSSFRGFYGYDWDKTAEFDDAMQRKEDSAHPKEKNVYIAPYGSVFHLDEHCSYISITPDMVSIPELELRRNQSGGKYYPCEKCINDSFSGLYVYVTAYGTRYHSSRNCSKIERNPLEITMTEAENMGRRPCSKCARKVVDQ